MFILIHIVRIHNLTGRYLIKGQHRQWFLVNVTEICLYNKSDSAIQTSSSAGVFLAHQSVPLVYWESLFSKSQILFSWDKTVAFRFWISSNNSSNVFRWSINGFSGDTVTPAGHCKNRLMRREVCERLWKLHTAVHMLHRLYRIESTTSDIVSLLLFSGFYVIFRHCVINPVCRHSFISSILFVFLHSAHNYLCPWKFRMSHKFCVTPAVCVQDRYFMSKIA